MFFLTPRYIKLGRQYVKDARKLLAYKRDLVSPELVQEVEGQIASLERAVTARDESAVDTEAKKLEKICGRLVGPVSDAAWRENVEVFLVAIVIALGVRTYFLQPFTIPTGSMQPTLNGINFHKTETPPPNVLVRVAQAATLGRAWIDVVAKDDELVIGFREFRSLLPFIDRIPFLDLGFFARTELITDRGNRYVVRQAREPLTRNMEMRQFRRGEPIIRGYFDTGDHVFVDKFTYNFRKPSRSDVFVFSTSGISYLHRPGNPSQFYIKRLAGVPGDTLRIVPPLLYVNGEVAKEEPFQRVMSMKNGYEGYTNGGDRRGWDQQMAVNRWPHLGHPNDSYTVPQKAYFALGDNSGNSLDSRAWGPAPERNIMGRAVLVYWPFTSHWGRIQ